MHRILQGLVFLVVVVSLPLLVGRAETTTVTDIETKLTNLQTDIKDKRNAYDELQSKTLVYKENLKAKQQETLTLQSEIEALDTQQALTETEIAQTIISIEKLGLEIEKTQLEIDDTQRSVRHKQGQIGTLIKTLYNYNQQSYLEVTLSNATLSEFSSQLEYTEQINTEFKEALEELQQLKQALQQKKGELEQDKIDTEAKKIELATRQQSLQGQTEYKNNLLVEIESDEEKFQQLVKDLQAEQTEINSEISTLEKSARKTLDELNQAKNATAPGEDNPTESGSIDLPTSFQPSWPVSGVITTYFHDPNYIFRRYFQHDAIDIASPCGTAIKAADAGVVGVVKYDGTSSYAYIMIVHADNFTTIYGHPSQVYVEPEEVVQKGQTIAAIGGMPGMVGSGAFSTGCHVHFGVRLNNIPLDPLTYLPK